MSRRVWASGLIRPDPRTKFVLILICVIAATIAPSLKYELLVVAAVAVFGALIGKWRSALTGLAAYALIYALTLWTVGNVSGLARGFLMAFFGILHKVYPCGMIAGLVIRTTRVNEFLAAMNRSRVPKKIVIPIAVMLRYLPAIREDWVSIHDAMRLRDVNPSLAGLITRPLLTAQCVYVPLMMAASKAADELAIASLTRGIENPSPRTSLIEIRMGAADIALIGAFAAVLAVAAVWK